VTSRQGKGMALTSFYGVHSRHLLLLLIYKSGGNKAGMETTSGNGIKGTVQQDFLDVFLCYCPELETRCTCRDLAKLIPFTSLAPNRSHPQSPLLY
jgi:hypothetical protein